MVIMKRESCIFDKMSLWNNLERAFYRASRKKRLKSSTLVFRKNYEANMENI